MRKFIVVATLAALLPAGACGPISDFDDLYQVIFGLEAAKKPRETAVPVFNDGSTKILGLKNHTNVDALVYVREHFGLPGCTVGTPVTVPGNGELRLDIGFTAGWIQVETGDPLTPDPVTGAPSNVRTTGHVGVYLAAKRGTQDAETMPACDFAVTGSAVRATPRTSELSLFNRSYLPFPGGEVCQAADFTAWYYDSSGNSLGWFSFTVLDASPFTIPLGPLAGGVVGQVYVTPDAFPQTAPAGTVFNFTMASMEDEDLAYQNALPFTGGTPEDVDAEMPLSFGRDLFGNYIDFALAMTNVSDEARSVSLNEMRGPNGEIIKSLPRTITLPAHATRFYATTLTESVGLEQGEVHPFADLFGDVFLETTLQDFRLSLTIPGDVALSGRLFEPGTFSFNQTVRPHRVTHEALVSDVEVQSSTQTAIRNIVNIMNPGPNAIEVFVRGFTPQQGTEYIFPSVMVPARGMLSWSPDGINVSEESAAPPPLLARVPFISFLFSSGSSFGAGGSRTRRDGAGLIVYITPLLVRTE